MPTVRALHASPTHHFSKQPQPVLHLIAGQGVEGDAHAGVTVQHRSRVARDPNQPNLRQVHLLHTELLAELKGLGFTVQPGDLGENISTADIDLLALPTGAVLRVGEQAVLQVTGLRNPCRQIHAFQAGLTDGVLGRDADGGLIRKAGVMAVVLASGEVHIGDKMRVELPAAPHQPLRPV